MTAIRPDTQSLNLTWKYPPQPPPIEVVFKDSLLDRLQQFPRFFKLVVAAKMQPFFNLLDTKHTIFVPDEDSWCFEPYDFDMQSRRALVQIATIRGSIPLGVLQSSHQLLLDTYSPQNRIKAQTDRGCTAVQVVHPLPDDCANFDLKMIPIVQPDLRCKNGIIHVISSPLWPTWSS
jgi:hypothetical protein